jgi:hypothetical protein
VAALQKNSNRTLVCCSQGLQGLLPPISKASDPHAQLPNLPQQVPQPPADGNSSGRSDSAHVDSLPKKKAGKW